MWNQTSSASPCRIMRCAWLYSLASSGLHVQLLKICHLSKPTLWLSGHNAVLKSFQDCTVALQPSPQQGFPSIFVQLHLVTPDPCIISCWCFPWLNSHLKLALSPASVSNDAACEPLCSQLFFRYFPLQALYTSTLLIPCCLCCAATMWFGFVFSLQKRTVSGRNRCSPT